MKTYSIKERQNTIQHDFFDLDPENKIAVIPMKFEKPGDIFSQNLLSKTPVLSEEFTDLLLCAYDLAPRRYKLDLVISFDDMEGYDERQLEDIFVKNVMLKSRIHYRRQSRQNMLGIGLCGTGLLFILLMTFLGRVWTEEGTFRDIVFYILDILATVPFWGAVEIFLIDDKERNAARINLQKRFHAISFRREGPPC